MYFEHQTNIILIAFFKVSFFAYLGSCNIYIKFLCFTVWWFDKWLLLWWPCWGNENTSQQDQVHLASRTHFVDLVIHNICSQKIIPYFVDLVIHDICSQKIMPYFHKWSSSIRNFAQWSTFCLSFLTLFFCSISFPSFYPLDFFSSSNSSPSGPF